MAKSGEIPIGGVGNFVEREEFPIVGVRKFFALEKFLTKERNLQKNEFDKRMNYAQERERERERDICSRPNHCKTLLYMQNFAQERYRRSWVQTPLPVLSKPAKLYYNSEKNVRKSLIEL